MRSDPPLAVHYLAKIAMKKKFAGFLAISVLAAYAQTAQVEAARPKFEDYKVDAIYRGAVVPVVIPKERREFRSAIRNGSRGPVTFAGHYTVPAWGCGGGCIQFVIVDAKTGKLYDTKWTVSDLTESQSKYVAAEEKDSDGFPKKLVFHPKSRLLKINGCLNEKECGLYDFEMVEGVGLKLVKKRLLPEK